mmetsp:Transcript_35066/g.88241  ORF Transcript_35066/g.88241 Transcript_35066/m.88241 type:complete len:371 (+) Transcript_35066:55-1167(+)
MTAGALGQLILELLNASFEFSDSGQMCFVGLCDGRDLQLIELERGAGCLCSLRQRCTAVVHWRCTAVGHWRRWLAEETAHALVLQQQPPLLRGGTVARRRIHTGARAERGEALDVRRDEPMLEHLYGGGPTGRIRIEQGAQQRQLLGVAAQQRLGDLLPAQCEQCSVTRHLAAERRHGQLGEHHAQRPDVHLLRVALVAAQLLGCRVQVCAQAGGQLHARLHLGRVLSGGGRASQVCRLDGAVLEERGGQPKVADLGVAVLVDEDVGRLEVAVHHVVLVDVRQALRNLRHDAAGDVQADQAVAPIQPLPHGVRLVELHLNVEHRHRVDLLLVGGGGATAAVLSRCLSAQRRLVHLRKALQHFVARSRLAP